MAQVLIQPSAPGRMKPRLPSLSEAGLDRFIFGCAASDDPSTTMRPTAPPKLVFLSTLTKTQPGATGSSFTSTSCLGPPATNPLRAQAQAPARDSLSVEAGAPLQLRPSAPPPPSCRSPLTSPQSSACSNRSESSPAPTSTSQDRSVEPRSSGMRAFRACAPCRAAHTACDHERPCRRCRVRQTPDSCVDLVTPYQQYLVKRRTPHACSTRRSNYRRQHDDSSLELLTSKTSHGHFFLPLHFLHYSST